MRIWKGTTDRGRMVRETTKESCIDSLALIANADPSKVKEHALGDGRWVLYRDEASLETDKARGPISLESPGWFAIFEEETGEMRLLRGVEELGREHEPPDAWQHAVWEEIAARGNHDEATARRLAKVTSPDRTNPVFVGVAPFDPSNESDMHGLVDEALNNAIAIIHRRLGYVDMRAPTFAALFFADGRVHRVLAEFVTATIIHMQLKDR